jgi:cytochrome P450
VFFSAFGRNCIGKHLALAEAKVIFCELLLKFRVIPALKNPKKILKFIVEFEDNHIVQFQKL